MKMIVDSIGNFDFNVLLAGFNDSSHVLTQVELISLIVLGAVSYTHLTLPTKLEV